MTEVLDLNYISLNPQDKDILDIKNLIDEISDSVGDISQLETDHKSDLVSAINELAGIIEKFTLVISLSQPTAEVVEIYNACIVSPHLAKNIVFFNSNDSMYYVTNGYKIDNEIIYLNTIMVTEGTLTSVTLSIASNGTISIVS